MLGDLLKHTSYRPSFSLLHKIIVWITIVLGGAILFGWIFHIDALIRIVPTWSGMNPLTATLFIVYGGTMLMARRNFLLGTILGSLTIAILAGLRIGAIYAVLPWSPDLIFFKQNILAAVAPSRMSLLTAGNFLLLSIALLLALSARLKRYKVPQVLTGICVIFSSIALLGYILSGTRILSYPVFFSAAAHTVMLFFLSSIFQYLWHEGHGKQEEDQGTFVALFVLMPMLILTILMWGFIRQSIEQTLRLDFFYEGDRLTDHIGQKLDSYTHILRGGAGLFDASQSVERDEWRKYVSSLNLQRNYPGVQALGFNRVINPEDKDAFTAAARKEGFSSFQIYPEGSRDTYAVYIYLEPFTEEAKNALGFDAFSEETRRVAMIRARDTEELTMTGKLILTQDAGDPSQAGFLIYAPVYENGASHDTLLERQQHIVGFVFAAFRVNDFMKSLLKADYLRGMDVHIYDGPEAVESVELFDYDDGVYSKAPDFKPQFQKTDTIRVGGRQWTIVYSSLPSAETSRIFRVLPTIILVAGLLVSFLLYAVFLSLFTSKKKALIYADQATRDLQISLREQARLSDRLRLATKSAHIGVWDWDVVKDVITWDDTMYKLYGIKKEDFGGAYDAWRKGLHPEDTKSGDDAIQAALKGEKDLDITFRVVWPSGDIRYIKAYAIVERSADGTPLHMIGVNFDVTREKEVDIEKTEFVSLASHQLKTPVGSLSWDLEMLQAGDYGKLTEKQAEVVAEMYMMNHRMNELIDSLLNVSRIETGIFLIEPVPVQLGAICDEVLKELAPKIAAKRHEVSTQYDPSLSLIPADPKLLRIIFQNYISNAVKYTPLQGRIVISIRKEVSDVLISVANNGAPIPAKDQSKIFSKLFRASNAQEQDPEGNGLGLYIVKKIAENGGGKAWFTSKEGEDTVFYVSFPISGMLKKEGTRALS